uniref:Velvet domain-containing protein n=1 Tax=Kwoniella bestiolae CBS 10118 TaxID=1296100 RepID=A0A1B9G6N3_9TREE|nr:hypothetical protein I302_04358 [Kwoniella bestiolae CBS 10118]OCF26671.1 hypothetical protein I302_04358 [Kwoniella bestiolae CBS 10118]
MKMRQQPVQARMCGVGEKSDRRPVDPTPIIQLKVIDENGEDITSTDPRSRTPLRRPSPGPNGMTFMQNPYYFLFACLVGGDENEDELHVIDDGKTRFLTGTPVSSLYHLKDLDNSDAAFFVFPDLGVRKEGRYKLKLTLFEIVDQEVYYCTTTFTSTFSVYSAKKFPGMSKATDLSKSFAEQGLKIRVRKDPRQRESTSSLISNQSTPALATQPRRHNLPRIKAQSLPNVRSNALKPIYFPSPLAAARITKSKRKSDAADSEDDYGSPNHHHSYAHHHSDQHKRQHPPPQHQQQHHHQAKRSRGASLGYPPNEAESAARFYRPTSSHGEASSKPTTYHPSYPPQSSSSNGYPPGYHPNYPPPGRGHHMPPPPPPSAFDPYRNHQALSPSYPPGYPTQYYGSNSGRPSTHPSPGPAPGSASRHHQSLPPPGYGPPEHPNFQHAQQQSPYYAHGQQPPSAGGYHQHQRTPSYPGSPYGEPSGQRGAPWPQSQMQDRERRDTYPQEPEREIAYAREREREREIERERERERERYMSSRGQPQRQRMRDGPRPLSPRSRVSPTRPTSISYQPSPTSSAGSTFGNNNNARPLSSSSRDRLEIVSPNNVTLPPLSLSTPTARNRPMGSGSAPNSAGLPPILSSAERDRERDEVLSQRSASTGIISSSRNQSPLLGSGTPSSAKTTDRMKLHNIVD